MRSGYSWSGHERNNCFINLGGGQYADISYLSGVGFTDDARGAAAIDWDADGDLDLWLNNRSAPKARFMRNEYAGGNEWVALRLVARNGNRDAVGARVELELADGKTLLRTVRASVNYTIQTTKWLHFGLGPEGRIASLRVRWPNGGEVSYSGVTPGARYEIVEDDPAPRRLEPAPPVEALRASTFDGPPETQVASVPIGVRIPLPPDFALEDFDGNRHPFANGQPTLVNFWASWCGGCKTEFADFVENRALLESAGVQILALSVDKPEDRDKAVDAAENMGLWFPAGMGDSSVSQLLDVMKDVVFDRYDDLPLPSSLLLDGKGQVARIYLGPCDSIALARDVKLLGIAQSESDTLYAASPYPTGRWLHPDHWLAAQRGGQLIKMTQFLHQDGLAELASFYSGQLADYLALARPPEAAAKKAAGAVSTSADAIVETDPHEAIRQYRQVLLALPSSVHARVGLTAALLELGDEASRKEAAAIFADVRPEMREPESATDLAILGTTLFRLGDPEAALPYLERALKEAPIESPFVRMCYGSCLIAVGRDGAGIESLTQAMAMLSPNAGLEHRLATALDRVGRPEEALVHHRRALELVETPTTIDEHALAGQTRFRFGDWGAAVTHLAAVVAAEPDRMTERGMLGLALAHLGRDAEALEHLEVAIPVLPPDENSEFVYGIVLARTGQLERAVERFARSLELDPTALPPLRSLALGLDRLGRTDEAIARFRAYLEAASDDVTIRQRLAGAYERAGRTAEAVAEYREMVDEVPEVRYRLAWILASSPDDDIRDGVESLRLAEDVVKSEGREHPAILDLLAAAYAACGRFDEAVATATEAVEKAVAQQQPDWAKDIETRLALYRRGEAFFRGS